MHTLLPASISRRLEDAAATEAVGGRIGRAAAAGDVLALAGELGCGKTTFARAVIAARAQAAGLPTEEVPSPTFTLVQTYDLPPCPIWHVDLWRLTAPEDVWELGLEDALGRAVILIEWPERMGSLLPQDRLDLGFTIEGVGRHLTLDVRGRPSPGLIAAAQAERRLP